MNRYRVIATNARGYVQYNAIHSAKSEADAIALAKLYNCNHAHSANYRAERIA